MYVRTVCDVREKCGSSSFRLLMSDANKRIKHGRCGYVVGNTRRWLSGGISLHVPRPATAHAVKHMFLTVPSLGDGLKMCREVPQERCFIGEVHPLDLLAALPHTQNDFHDVVDMALRVHPARYR